MRKIGVLTSGGDSPGMNAAIRAVVRCGIDAGFEVWGIERGFEGLLDGELRVMDRSSVGDILHRGGTVLKTARSERFMEDRWIDKAADLLKTLNIDGLVVIGGDRIAPRRPETGRERDNRNGASGNHRQRSELYGFYHWI